MWRMIWVNGWLIAAAALIVFLFATLFAQARQPWLAYVLLEWPQHGWTVAIMDQRGPYVRLHECQSRLDFIQGLVVGATAQAPGMKVKRFECLRAPEAAE